MANDQDTVLLELLQDIEQKRFMSQRQFASKLGIAVGLSNSYVKRCIRKGWIKMRRAPARRYVYYLTPAGFREKSRLTVCYLTGSFTLYRRARREYLDAFHHCLERGWQRVGLFGTGDLAEVAALSARESGHSKLVVIEPDSARTEFLGFAVTGRLETVANLDAVLITDMDGPQRAYHVLREHLAPERIVAIPLLGVVRSEHPAAEDRTG